MIGAFRLGCRLKQEWTTLSFRKLIRPLDSLDPNALRSGLTDCYLIRTHVPVPADNHNQPEEQIIEEPGMATVPCSGSRFFNLKPGQE